MEKLRPDIYQKNLTDIHFNQLKKAGIKILLFDVDNTILRYKEKEIDKNIIDLIKAIKTQFTVVLFSNGNKRKVGRVAEILEVPYISNSLKPLSRNFKKVFIKYKVTPNEVAIIGDQILTDIKGGNNVGITTILIEPLSEKESPFTKINRSRENTLMRRMGAKGLFIKERYYE